MALSDSPQPDEPRRYTVFISYAHADNVEMGRKWASWLLESLESYEVPTDLIGSKGGFGATIPPNLYPVFRDEEELPANADLSSNIRQALDHSSLLVVLCSPRAVSSRYVADEIRYFKEIGKSGRIFALIIDGEPNVSDNPEKLRKLGADFECFPEPLRFGSPTSGEDTIDWTTRSELTAADVRPGGRCEQGWTNASAYNEALIRESDLPKEERVEATREYAKQLELAKAKIIAGALSISLGELTQRDKTRQLEKAKRRARILLILVTIFALLAGIAGLLGWYSQVQKVEADRQRNLVVEREKEAQTARERERKQEQLALENAATNQAYRDLETEPLRALISVVELIYKSQQQGEEPPYHVQKALGDVLEEARETMRLPISGIRDIAAKNDCISVSTGNSVFAYDLDGNQLFEVSRPDQTVMAMSVVDSRRLMVSWSSNTLELFDLDTQTSKVSLKVEDGIRILLTLEGGSHIASDVRGSLWMIPSSLEEPELLARMEESNILAMVADRGASRLLTKHSNGTIRLWNLKDSTLVGEQSLNDSEGPANPSDLWKIPDLITNPDEWIWEDLVTAIHTTGNKATDLVATKCKKLLFANSLAHQSDFHFPIEVWDIPTSEVDNYGVKRSHRVYLKGHRDSSISNMSYMRGRDRAISADSGHLFFWDLAPVYEKREYRFPGDLEFLLHSVESYKNGNYFMASSPEGVLSHWFCPQGIYGAEFTAHNGYDRSIPSRPLLGSCMPGANRAVTASEDTVLRVWESEGFNLTFKSSSPALKKPIEALAYAPTGEIACWLKGDDHIQMYDEDWVVVRELPLQNAELETPPWGISMRFNREGTIMVASTKKGEIALWNLKNDSFSLIETPAEYSDIFRTRIFDLDTSPDGTLVACAGGDRRLHLVSLSKGEVIFSTDPSPTFIQSVRFSKAGDRIAIGEHYGGVRIWNLEGQRTFDSDDALDSPVLGLEFVSNDQMLICGGIRSAASFRVNWKSLLALGCERLQHNPKIQISEDLRVFINQWAESEYP